MSFYFLAIGKRLIAEAKVATCANQTFFLEWTNNYKSDNFNDKKVRSQLLRRRIWEKAGVLHAMRFRVLHHLIVWSLTGGFQQLTIPWYTAGETAKRSTGRNTRPCKKPWVAGLSYSEIKIHSLCVSFDFPRYNTFKYSKNSPAARRSSLKRSKNMFSLHFPPLQWV